MATDGKGGRPRDDGGQRLVPAEEVSLIVREAVNRVSETFKVQTAELKGEIQELKKSNQQTLERKDYTREQLDAAVGSGKITQTESDRIWEDQQATRIATQVTDQVTSTLSNATRTTAIQGKIDQYKRFDPALMEEGSEARTRIKTAIREIADVQGLEKPTLATELLALSQVYGPVDRLHDVNEHDREVHQDVYSGGGSGDDRRPIGGGKSANGITVSDDGSVKGLTTDERRYGEAAVGRGLYKSLADYAKEVRDYGNPALRKRVSTRG